jgi:hypothetical protein
MNKEDYEIIDNFLEKEDFENIKNLIMGPNFPWYYRDGVVEKENDKKNKFQFSHLFYTNNSPTSTLLNELSPILLKINAISLLHVKANLNPRLDILFEHGFHTDYTDPILNQRTAVFYLNTNNGYTLFEDGTKIESVENRLVSFKTSIPHTGSTCTDANRRVLINFNYII